MHCKKQFEPETAHALSEIYVDGMKATSTGVFVRIFFNRETGSRLTYTRKTKVFTHRNPTGRL